MEPLAQRPPSKLEEGLVPVPGLEPLYDPIPPPILPAQSGTSSVSKSSASGKPLLTIGDVKYFDVVSLKNKNERDAHEEL